LDFLVFSKSNLAQVRSGRLPFSYDRGALPAYTPARTFDPKKLIWTRVVSPYQFAVAYIGLGEHDLALQWLQQARQDRDYQIRAVKVAPFFEHLRPDPRFQALLREMKFPEK
jgi:hypothetical protein